MKKTIARPGKGLFSALLFICLCSLSFNAAHVSNVHANTWLTVAGADEKTSFDINRGAYTELFKFKITAGSEDIKITNMRLYGENQDGGIVTKTDVGRNGDLYDETGNHVAVGTLYEGCWSFIYMSLEIPAGQSKTLTFKNSVSETTEISKVRISANEKYIGATKTKTGESVKWNDTSVARSEELMMTDVRGPWVSLNASTKPRISDLTIMDGYSSPANPYSSDRVCYKVSIKNFGLADLVGKEIFANVSINQKFVGKKSLGANLKIGEEIYKEIFCSDQSEGGLLHVGSNTLEFVLDPDNSITELNEGNNSRTFGIKILDSKVSLPDLVPIEPDCHVATANGGTFVVCNYKIQNNGSVQVTGRFKVMANGNTEEWAATPPAGKWGNSTITADVPSDGKITIMVDPDNLLHENDEVNNAVVYTLPGYEDKQVAIETDIKDGSLVRVIGDPKVYLIKGNYRYWIRTMQDFRADGFDGSKIITVNADSLKEYSELSYVPQGRVVVRAAGDSRVYRIIGGRKIWVPSAQVFEAQGLEWGNVSEILRDNLSSYPELKLMRGAGSDAIFYVTNSGMKKLIINTEVFNSYGNKYEDVVEVDSSVLDSFEAVNLIKDEMGKVYRIDGNQKKWIRSPQAFARHGFDWNKIAPVNNVEINAYVDGGTIE